MLSRPLPFRGRAFLGLAALVLSLSFAAALPAEAPKSELTLTLGEETPERSIQVGEAQGWRLEVPPGTAVLVAVDQHSVHLVLAAQGPPGVAPLLSEAGNSRWGPAVLLLEAAGPYRIEVRSEETSAWPGRYTIRTEALPAPPAESARREAFALMSRAAQEATPDTPDSRKQAIVLYRQAQAAWHSLGDRAWEAEALFCLSLQEKRANELAQATQDFQAALPLWEQIEELHRKAETLNLLGEIYPYTEGADKARQAKESAVELWHRLGERADEAETASNLCNLEPDPEAAVRCQQESLEAFRGLGDQGDQLRVLINLGSAYDSLGDLDDALASYQQVLDLQRKLRDPRGEFATLNNIALAHRHLGEWQEALRIYGEAREILPRLGDNLLAGTLLNNIGVAYDQLGEPERALPYLADALIKHRAAQNRSGEVNTLNTLGSALRKLGKLDNALALHREALKLARDKLHDATQLAISRQRCAEVDLDRGNASAALSELDEAARLEKVDLKTRTDILSLRGRALVRARRTQEAIPILQEVLARRQAVRDRAGEADTLDELAVAYRSLGLAAEARAHAKEALERVEELRTGLASPDLRASFLATRQRAFALLIELLMDQDAAEPGKGHGREAFAISEQGRARSLLDALRTVPAASAAPGDLAKQRRSLLRQLDLKVDQRWKQSGDKAAALEGEIDEIRSGIDQVEAKIRAQGPRLPSPTVPALASPEEIAGGLEPGTMLLEYSLGEKRSFLWAIDSRGLRSFVLPVSQKRIEALARQAYQELSGAGPGTAHPGRSIEALSRILLGPIWNGRSARLHRLVVVPDASLQLIPFAALPVPDPGHGWNDPGIGRYLLEHLEVVYVPSATTLAAQRQRLQKRRPALQWAVVFADPVFAANGSRPPQRSRGTERGAPLRAEGTRGLPLVLAPLPATRKEAQAIRDLEPAGKVRLDLGLNANREAVLSGKLRDYRFLHFATHAVADTRTPELSGLMLSQVDAAGHPQEGFLGLSDIYELDLNADLVVLSGCQTALGKEVRGEGLMGLTRGFQYAGVPRVVASLWKVDDRATAELMTRFYKEMWQGNLTAAAALTAAQRSLRQNLRYRDPYSWAGFVLQGDWQ
jgi:CHAT domain-containing protein